MKLIIDIPKNAYDLLQGEGVDWLGAEHILDAVAKGKPVEECEDCVSLDAVIDVFDTWWMHNHESDNAIEILEDKLNALPPVTAEKVGQWIPVSEIENIKSEINELSELDHIEPTYEDCKRDVLKILDKYKASPTGAESEE